MINITYGSPPPWRASCTNRWVRERETQTDCKSACGVCGVWIKTQMISLGDSTISPLETDFFNMHVTDYELISHEWRDYLYRLAPCTETRARLNEDMPPYPSTSNGWQIGPPGQDGATRRFTTNNWILLNRQKDQKQHTYDLQQQPGQRLLTTSWAQALRADDML